MAQYLQHSGDSWVRWLHHDKTCLQMEQLRTIMKASIKELGARWVWKSHHRPKQKAAAPGSYLRNVLSNKTIQDTILSQYFLWLFCPFLHQQQRPALTHVDIDSTTGMRRPIQSPQSLLQNSPVPPPWPNSSSSVTRRASSPVFIEIQAVYGWVRLQFLLLFP